LKIRYQLEGHGYAGDGFITHSVSGHLEEASFTIKAISTRASFFLVPKGFRDLEGLDGEIPL
jgi:hypothetical protein